MSRKAQLELEDAIIEAARDEGRDYFKQNPQALLIAAARHGATLFDDTPRQIAFLNGYRTAREQHEEFLMESDR